MELNELLSPMTTSIICKICGSESTLLYDALHDRMQTSQASWSLIRCINLECGLIWIDPMPDEIALSTAYKNYYTHSIKTNDSTLRHNYLRSRNSYIRRRFGYPATEETWLIRAMGNLMARLPHRRIGMDATVMWLPCHPKGKLLEIGCGNGDRLAFFKELGWEVSGIEPDAEAAQLASARGLNILTGKLQSESLPSQSFDAIVLSHVIEHVQDPNSTIRECYRLLRPGGRLTILTPNTESLGHHWFGRNWLHLDAPRHLNLFNSRNLSKVCADQGFIDIAATTTPRDSNWTIGASLVLQNGDCYIIGQLPFFAKLFGICMFYFEWLVLLIKHKCGEELLVIARRNI